MRQPKLIFEKESLEENLNPLYYKRSINEIDFQNFKKNVENYLDKIYQHKDKKKEVWLVRECLQPFLENIGFKGCVEAQYHQKKANKNSTIDLVLKSKDCDVEVIFEAKKPDNHNEMFSARNTTAKAMCEAILYYIRERDNSNVDLKFIILTDFFNFYIFKAKEFEKLFYKNPRIKKIYDTKAKDNNQDFYQEIEKTLSSDLFDRFLYGLHIDLRLFENDSKKYKNIFKVFHRDYLLSEYRPDSNRINQRFFDELLFVLGLKQDSKTNKIEIDTEQNTSLITTIYAKLTEKLGDSTELFDKSMELLIVWLNRILFLKLIETNLSHFNSENGFQPFLTKDKIKDFKTLEHLFFEVLAKNYATRKEDKGFNYIPYLNSSLFLKKELESHLSIKDIDNFDITPYRNTQVRDINTHKKITDKLPFLEYLFEFLNAFDFGKDFEKHPKNKQDKQTQEAQDKGKISDSDNAMDSRILGLVFENLNGFKEGSFYTPGFITEYMCKESLEKVILEKFNNLFSAKVQDLENARELLRIELKSGNTQAKDQLKEALLSIRVCDPSVGSGHFLASALNYLCYYFDYFNLVDLENINLSVENDTLKQGFHYKRPKSKEEQNHKNQKALFTLKKEIIESCLFGVDINPISCEIARLRLWIELLKNSYYIFENGIDSNIHKLETLPNIDINIKCGNSLVSRFDLQEYDEHNKPKIHTLAWLTNNNTNFANNFKEQIKNYKQQVNLYKNAFGNKKDIADKIEAIKTLFRNHLVMVSPIATELESNLRKFVQKYGDETFDIETPFGMEMIKIIRKKNQEQKGFRFQPTLENPNPSPIDKKANDLLQTIKKDYEALESLKEDSFEWRFAFPEVLDSNGDFIGFDLVIGNPPYIRQEEIKHLKPQLQKSFKIYKGTSDIYTYFYEQGHKILKHNGILSFITSNKYCRAGYGEPLREFLLEATALLYYIELNGIKVFDSATVDTSILIFIKTTPDSKHTFDYAHPKDYDTKANVPLQEYITPQSLLQSSLSKESFIFQDSTKAALKAKIEKIGTPLKEWDISIYRGILTGYNEAFIIDSKKRDEILSNCVSENERQRTSELIKPILRGRDIKRYSYEWAGLWIIFISWHFPNTQNPKSMEENEADLAEQYPSLYNHLLYHKEKLSKRNKDETGIRYEWYCLQRYGANYYQEFAKEKIVYSEIVREPQFYLDSGEFKFGNFYAEATSFILSGNENFKHSLHYLLGILHSKLITYAFKEFYAGGGLGESGYRYKKAFLERLPIPKVDSKTEAKFIQIVQEIVESKKQGRDTKELESTLDTMVCKLYNLSQAESDSVLSLSLSLSSFIISCCLAEQSAQSCKLCA